MSDNEYNMDLKYDMSDFPSMELEEDQVGSELLDQEEEQSADYMEPSVCWRERPLL